jgi:hypothetical protein
MTDEFMPANVLEEKLLSLYQGQIDLPLFVQVLLNSKVVVALEKEIDKNQPNWGMNPLVLMSPKGYRMLAAFTSPERINMWFKAFPNYRHSLYTDTRWFLKGAKDDVGFGLNPGWPYGLEIDPSGLKRLKDDFGIKGTPNQAL